MSENHQIYKATETIEYNYLVFGLESSKTWFNEYLPRELLRVYEHISTKIRHKPWHLKTMFYSK